MRKDLLWKPRCPRNNLTSGSLNKAFQGLGWEKVAAGDCVGQVLTNQEVLTEETFMQTVDCKEIVLPLGITKDSNSLEPIVTGE